MSKTRVLLTGATGFLGRNILQAAQADNDIEVVTACRNPKKLASDFRGEVRQSDLRDADYRRSLFVDIDVFLHVGTWGAFWGHKEKEKSDFFDVAKDLIDLAVEHKITKFALASTIALSGRTIGIQSDDFETARKTGFWPHLDYLVELDAYMRDVANDVTNMTTMRLGHFVGAGNSLGIVPALTPRLKTYLVPWLAGGHNRLPLVSGADMGRAFVAFSRAADLSPYESFNICSEQTPTMREVVSFVSERANVPKPIYSVPFFSAYLFGGLMEVLHPVLPGKAPFLTRSLVHVSEDRKPSVEYARDRLGFSARDDWQVEVLASLDDVKESGFAWPKLAQA